MKKSILVTGGAGFIGSHTVVALHEAGYRPIIVDNFVNAERSVIDALEELCQEKISVYEGDCTDEAFMQTVFNSDDQIGGVIHFAAYKAVGESMAEPMKYYQNNLGSLFVLLEGMKAFQIPHLVFSSSATVYGDPDQLPLKETAPRQEASSPYGNTKVVCEDIIRDCVAAGYDLKCISLRYFNPIGAHSSALIGELPIGVPNNLVPFITQTAAGVRDQLTVFGDDYDTPDGTCIRDYIHVVDLAEAHVKSLDYLQGVQDKSLNDFINLGTGKGNSVLEVVQAFEEATGEKVNYAMGGRRSGDAKAVYADVAKAAQMLGWKTKHTLQDALNDAWKWQLKLMEKQK